ncbi:hypothetical protein [Mycolicibacterium litorale]|uniref:Integral membrane protein n=1 Tax=Mycolicibacterium litorale TaxID=758802 RepID=A0AAD1MST0_9MYCO|nr:hypothetical protein [Mycolicibacterium litorale]MCV7418670.1 hypothetical protein [Mycolicibacterium litorale]TDY05932.1 hypothetical protein BCL50_2243 [Mycolicibacterium litorale]BBY14562.1 hypothetical protein MLIT_01540 [Mycolicibacterium litorale]
MTATADTARTGARDRLLRLAMRADAVMTGLAGLAALPLAGTLAELSGTTTAIEYSLAAFFIGYGVVVFGLAALPLPSLRGAGVAVIAANILYAVAAVIVVVTDVWSMTGTGIALTLATGVYTLVFAELQYVGWRRL